MAGTLQWISQAWVIRECPCPAQVHGGGALAELLRLPPPRRGRPPGGALIESPTPAAQQRA